MTIRAAFAAGALCTLWLIAIGSATPLITLGSSKDPWQSLRPPGQCQPLNEAFYAPVFGSALQEALPMLQIVPVVQLRDDETFRMLGLRWTSSSDSAAAVFLKARLEASEDARRRVYEQHKGSWGVVDEERLAELRQAVADLERKPLIPYLARGLTADAGKPSRFDAS